MKTNVKATVPPKFTAEGARAYDHLTPTQALRRSVLSCLLWEDGFYEDGQAIAERIHTLAQDVPLETLCALAVEARSVHHLRHVSLWLLIAAIQKGRGNPLVSETIVKTIQRADELSELVALYWKDGKKPLAKQMKKGLAAAFRKFDGYALAKYDRDSTVKLRDVLFLTHAKPKDEDQEKLWKSLVDRTLIAPDTWEVNLSAGKDKRETFERLLREQTLGYQALLKNLRGMSEAGVDEALINAAILARKGAHKVFPFRFIAAAKAAPRFEASLDEAFVANLLQAQKLPGKTVVIVDVSGSMYQAKVSAKSDMDRAQAACAVAAILREYCESPVIYATAGDDRRRIHNTQMVPGRRGMALVDALYGLCHPLGGGGIFLKQVMDYVDNQEKTIERVVVVTDEQDCAAHPEDMPSRAKQLGKRRYMINVGTDKNGIGYGPWTHIDGFSESVIKFIVESESVASQS